MDTKDTKDIDAIVEKSKKLMYRALAGLILDEPFFASLALRLKMEADLETETAKTDGTYIRYNPVWVATLTTDLIKGLICHEVMHCALHHHTRMGNRNPTKWNKAADYAINPLIVDAGMALPPGGLLEEQFKGKSAEAIYPLLPDESEDSGGGSSGKKGSGWGDVEPAKGPDGKPVNDAEKRKQEQNWKVALAQAAQQAKNCGKLSRGMERLVTGILEPKLDWREILRKFVDTCARNDYSWSRPNRRYISSGIYLPALHSNELGTIVAAVDTSGSIGQDLLNEFAAELNAILQEYQADCTVIYCDSAINRVDEFPVGEPISLKSHGGGGTDFRPPFDYLEEQDKPPVCFIYFTDGQCSSYPEIPSYPVLWVQKQISNYWASSFEPPFGDVLEL